MLRETFCLVCSVLALSASAQEILDNTAYYRVEYTYRYKKDSIKTGYYKDTYFLDICKSGHSYFYSRANQYRDSVSAALLASGEHWMEVVEKTRPIPKGVSWNIDKRFIEGKYHYTNKLGIHFYRACENLQMPQWKLTKDTLTISGYLCYKATAEVAGRMWEAWYTPQIPVNDGPWLLWGLPGLIIHAHDSNRYFKFRCESVGQLAEPYRVFLPADNKDVKEMKIKDLMRAERMAETDFNKFETTYMNVISGSASASPKKKYYIPIYLVK
jgi:GLPGLI family protein